MSFQSMKNNRAKLAEELSKKLQEQANNTSGEYAEDKRFWYPKLDKAGNGSAVIRFLPAPDGEDFPFIRVWSHSFKGPTGKWYIENSLTTIGQDDPVGEYNTKLWNSTTDKEAPARKQASTQKRNLSYTSNVLVIKDPATPENEGKLFLYKYGAQIFNKINEKMNPDVSLGEEKMNPFDFWEGADFRLKIRKVEGQTNYTTSTFDNPSVLFNGDDEKLEKLYNQLYSLVEFHSPKYFKAYDVLKAHMEKVLCLDGTSTNKPVTSRATDEVEQPKETKKTEPVKLPTVEEDNDTDEVMNFLKTLQN